MSETVQIAIGICILLGVFVLTRRYHAWQVKRAFQFIIEDLKTKGAMNPKTAVDLPYCRRNVLGGLKDHRPTALKSLVLERIVGISEDGKYYLLDKRF